MKCNGEDDESSADEAFFERGVFMQYVCTEDDIKSPACPLPTLAINLH